MLERLRWTWRVMRSGLYDWRALLAGIVGVAALLTDLAALDPSILPAPLQTWLEPHAGTIREIGKWALLVTGLAGWFAANAKPLLVPTPLAGAPTLLDDESGGEARGAKVDW